MPNNRPISNQCDNLTARLELHEQLDMGLAEVEQGNFVSADEALVAARSRIKAATSRLTENKNHDTLSSIST